jgi:chromate reductase, NAD(P)H dehydrogenase (quinone)
MLIDAAHSDRLLPPVAGQVRIAMFGGSLRRESLNKRLLEHCIRIAAPLCDVLPLEIADLPHYNQDDDPGFGLEGRRPPEAQRFWDAMETVDGVVIVSPEYSWSVPGVIKNAIEWVSRPPFNTPLVGRAVLLVGGSTGPAGTGRAMFHMRQILQSTRSLVLVDDVQVPFAQTRIDAEGGIDAPLEARLSKLLAELVDEAKRARDENLPDKLRIVLPPEVVRGEVIPQISPG